MSGRPRLSDEADFIESVRTKGIAGTAKALGITTGSVYERRERIEKRTGQSIPVPDWRTTRTGTVFPGRLEIEIENGIVLIGSDAHFWPGIVSPAFRAFVKFCKELKPAVIIMNGDMVDGASISRHPPIGWEDRPSVIQEIETTQERLAEVMNAAPKARRFWPLGNHDARFETRLATVAPEFAKVHGVHLQDHFPDWEPCWSVAINGHTMVKHRWAGGIHAVYNNVLRGGWNIFTSHRHSPEVRAYTDLNGTRWGTDTGTLADPWGPQFEYQEDNPRNHRSGFAVAQFHKGRLLMPQLCLTLDGDHVEFERRVVRV
jgi:hypothetical protein